MEAVVLRADELNLPETIARKLKGRKVEIIEENNRIIITPIEDAISKAFGMFEGGKLTTEKFLEQKRMDEN